MATQLVRSTPGAASTTVISVLQVKNATGGDVFNVTAQIQDDTMVQVVAGEVTVGDIPVSAVATSTNAYTIEIEVPSALQLRHLPLRLTLEYDDAQGNHQVLETSAIQVLRAMPQ